MSGTKVESDAAKNMGSPYAIEVTLPSKGKFYDGKIPEGKVRLRPITVEEEKLFLATGRRSDIADRVLARCIESPLIILSDMLMTDKFYLLLTLRALSYGQDYAFKLVCPSCSTEFNHTLRLPEGLKLKVADDTDIEPFEVKLPLSGKTLQLRHLRGYDETEIDNYLKQLPNVNTADGDPAYAFRLSRFIVSIDNDVLDTLQKLQFCETMLGRDSLAMRNAIQTHETGPDLTLEVNCPSCRRSIRSSLPMTNEFFPASVS